MVAKERELWKEQENVNQQVNGLLRAKSGEEANPTDDNDDIIDIPDTTVEGTSTTEEGGIATRTRARRAESGTVLAYLDEDWRDKIKPPKFNRTAYWNSIIMTQMSAKEGICIHGDGAIEVIIKEWKQLDNQEVMEPLYYYQLTAMQQKRHYELSSVLKKKER